MSGRIRPDIDELRANAVARRDGERVVIHRSDPAVKQEDEDIRTLVDRLETLPATERIPALMRVVKHLTKRGLV